MELVLRETQELRMGWLHRKEEWKCVSVVCGGVFAALAGTLMMPMLCVGSLVSLDPVSQSSTFSVIKPYMTM